MELRVHNEIDALDTPQDTFQNMRTYENYSNKFGQKTTIKKITSNNSLFAFPKI